MGKRKEPHLARPDGGRPAWEIQAGPIAWGNVKERLKYEAMPRGFMKGNEDIWETLKELQKDPKFVKAVKEFIKRATS